MLDLRRGLAEPPRRLIVDLSGVRFCGTAGIGALVQARVKAQAQATELVLVCSHPVSRTLDLTGRGDRRWTSSVDGPDLLAAQHGVWRHRSGTGSAKKNSPQQTQMPGAMNRQNQD